MAIKHDWVLGYGERYTHLVVLTEISKVCKKTHFACGKWTDCAVDSLADWAQPTPKCPTCLDYERSHKEKNI